MQKEKYWAIKMAAKNDQFWYKQRKSELAEVREFDNQSSKQ